MGTNNPQFLMLAGLINKIFKNNNSVNSRENGKHKIKRTSKTLHKKTKAKPLNREERKKFYKTIPRGKKAKAEYNIKAIRTHMNNLSANQKVQASLFIFNKKLQNLTVSKARELFIKNLPSPEQVENETSLSRFSKDEEAISSSMEREINEEKIKWDKRDEMLEKMDDDSFLKYVTKKVDKNESSALNEVMGNLNNGHLDYQKLNN